MDHGEQEKREKREEKRKKSKTINCFILFSLLAHMKMARLFGIDSWIFLYAVTLFVTFVYLKCLRVSECVCMWHIRGISSLC